MTPQQFWNDYMKVYDVLTYFSDYRKMLEDLTANVRGTAREKVLDAGSGTGNLSVLLTQRGCDVWSLDFSETALAAHKAKDPEAQTIHASLCETLPLEDNSFDVIVCASVLFALPEEGRKNALKEFNRILRPSGKLFVSVMKQTTSKSQMLSKHIKQRYRLLPFGAFALEALNMCIPFYRFMLANRRMSRLAKQGAYQRFGVNELISEISNAGFGSVSTSEFFGGAFHLYSTHPKVA